MAKRPHRPANVIITVVKYLIYIGLLVLFGWQTWQFVSFLFPDDQLLMKVLTLISFDVMALFWACADLYYAFASRGAKTWVRTAWILTFFISLLASILYLVIQSMFRFQLTVSIAFVDTGYAISIVTLTFNIVALMMYIYLEHNARNPHQDEFEGDWITKDAPVQALLQQEGKLILPPAHEVEEQVTLFDIINNKVARAVAASDTTKTIDTNGAKTGGGTNAKK